MATVKRTKAQVPKIIEVTVQQLRRQAQDIADWRSSLKLADANNRKKLYDLYEDVLLDGKLSDALDKRTLAITNADLIFTNHKGEQVEQVKNLMEEPEWKYLMEEIMNARYWGVTLLELSFNKKGEFEVFSWPRTHIDVKNKLAKFSENDMQGYHYGDDPFFVEIRKKRTKGREDFGIILKACPFVIYKRGNFGDWAQFCELFGMPFRLAKYDSNDPETKQQLDYTLDNSGSAPYAVIPKSSEMEFIPNNSNSNGEVYDKLKKACDEEILVTVLGQTLTTIQGDKGARSLGEIHMEVQKAKHEDDRKFVQSFLNKYIKPFLEQRGFPVADGSFNFPEKGENISLKDRINIDTKLSSIVSIDDSYWYETYGIPKPKSTKPKQAKTETEPKGEPKPKEDNDKQEKLFDRLLNFFVPARRRRAISGNLLTSEALNLTSGFDYSALLKDVAAENIDFSPELFEFTYSKLIDAFRAGWSNKSVKLFDMSFEYGVEDEVAQTMMEANIFRFSASKTLAQCQELNKMFREAKSFSDFVRKAEQLDTKFNKTWLQAEYETALLTAESSSNYYRLMSKLDIFPYWQYKTV
ncbi:MAG: DUF935 family protein, partial [Bacteroidales bacterium]